MRCMFPLAALSVAMLGACASVATRPPELAQASVERGRFVVLRSCAGCHDVGGGAGSPNPSAPRLTQLLSRYDAAGLRARLHEISRDGHREMPPIYMTDEEIADIVAYLGVAPTPVEPLPGLRTAT